MIEKSRMAGELSEFSLNTRIASQPFHSMGHGCDILVLLSDNVPDWPRLGLQPGSVILMDSTANRLEPENLPSGAIVYAAPCQTLAQRNEEGPVGTALAAVGALLHLLGSSADALLRWTTSVSAPRSLAAGADFARRTIEKRDAYSLPAVDLDGSRGVLLDAEQAVRLGYAVSACECRTICDSDLIASPIEWTTQHLRLAESLVSVLESDRHPGVQAFRGPQGKVMALLRGNDGAIASCLNGFTAPKIFVAADLLDVVRLVMAGHHLVRAGESDGFGILIEESLASRRQSIEPFVLGRLIRELNHSGPDRDKRSPSVASATIVERDGDPEADVGFVAWGAAQGVVRDAVALCRSLGLNVAGLYLKQIVPFHHEEIESFAKTVGRVVVVESGQTQGYWDRLRGSFSFVYTTLTPQQDQPLTPMDIFLREGLGAV